MLTVDALNDAWLSAERVVVLIATGQLLTHPEIEASALAGLEYGVCVRPDDASPWDDAFDVLAAAVLAEKLVAWGRRAKAFGDPDHAAPLEQISTGHFARVRVMASNWTHPRDPRDRGPVWWQVGFRRSEVVALWPPNAKRDRSAELAKLMLAMQQAASPRLKREAGIAKLRKETGCTAREALAAWNALPSDLRGKRGNRPR